METGAPDAEKQCPPPAGGDVKGTTTAEKNWTASCKTKHAHCTTQQSHSWALIQEKQRRTQTFTTAAAVSVTFQSWTHPR